MLWRQEAKPESIESFEPQSQYADVIRKCPLTSMTGSYQ